MASTAIERQPTPASRAIAALKRLSSAPWQAWHLQEDAELPPKHVLGAWVVAGAVQQGHLRHPELLQQLLAALGHGMAQLGKLQLLPSDLHEHKEQLALLRRLWEGLAVGWGVCTNPAACGLSEAQAQHATVQLPVMATKAGLFSATSSGCSTLAAVINAHAAANQAQQEPAQQQRQSPDELEGSGVAALAATLLLASTQISDAWPGGSGFLSTGVAPSVPALVDLAVAVIRSPAAARSYKPQLALLLWDVEVSNPLQAAVVFTWCFASSLEECFTRSKKEQVLEQLDGSAAVGELLLLALGLTAQLQHEQQQGLSPAPAAQPQQQEAQGRAQQERQQLVVPPDHQQLLKVLGLPGRVSGVAQAAWPRCPPNVVSDEVWSVLGVTLTRPDLALLPIRRDTSGTSSSSSSSSSSKQAQQPGHQAATRTGMSAFVPALLVVVEIVALQPDARKFVAALDRLAEMLQPVLDRSLELQLAKHLLPAVLRQLLPAAKHAAALHSQPGAAAAASEQEKLQLLEVHLPAIVGQLTRHAVGTPKGSAAAATAFAQHTEEYSALLQAALRHNMQHSDHVAVARQNDSIPRLLCSAADSTVLEAVSAGRQLPLLLVSLLKAFLSRSTRQLADILPGGAANSDTFSVMQRDLLGCAQTVMSKLADCVSTARQAASTDASSNSSSSSHSQRQLLAVLLARCLVVVGRLLQAQMEQTTALLAAPVDKQCEVVVCRQQALQNGHANVDLLVEELQSLAAAHPAQLPSAALQQLADEHVQPFTAAWQDCQAEMPADAVEAAASLGAFPPAFPKCMQSPAAARAAQQQEAFGAAVAGLLPLPDCCNYHGCNSASRVSEGDLVSGNSCVCGGCGVARYCSRECQVAHYKGWHKAACKRLQQQQE